VIAFDARTLDVVDHWQNTTPAPDSDSDFGASPTLVTAEDGTPLVAISSKDGWLYVFRRGALGAGPAWKYPLAVPGDPLQGEASISTPTFANGLLYAAGGRTLSGEVGSVIAFSPGAGQVRWKHVPPGYVLAGTPSVGEVLVVESTAPDNNSSWLEVLNAATGDVLKRFSGGSATYAAPSVSHGLILWIEYSGRLHALAAPEYFK
jgi:outer membrane protein assembly factor BamB